eukprot:TRINITY_DN1307_c0_g5_i1.p2 TRINITY_DN1307_c0_g5~~TRINITY_DN1307_c0_g5_i1.p2  ORF type:complete len:237 (-),score=48.28 TRINITY_DN1307_c0_g5_i1:95-805(-)
MQKTKTILVWPWRSEQLEYHVIMDTFVNGVAPDEARCILPDSCFPDPSDPVKPPEPSVELRKNIIVDGAPVDINAIFVAGTGLDEADPNKARIDRARVTLSVSNSTVDAIVAFVLPDEKLEHLIPFHQLMFAKGLEEVPTFFVCLGDPSFAKGLAIQQRAMTALANYGTNWRLKSIPLTPTPAEATQLFADILSESSQVVQAAQAAQSGPGKNDPRSSSAKTSSGGGRERRGCVLF